MAGRWFDYAYQRLISRISVEGRAKDFSGQIEIDAARPPRHRRMYRARNSNADILGLVDAESRFGVWLCRVHLVKFFVVALLEIHDLSVA